MSVDLALVQKAGPLTYTNEDETLPDRAELTAIYESYASLYPNPRLVEEQQEQDRLQRALSAASEATELNPPKPKNRGGFFSFLFGSSSPQETTTTATASITKNAQLLPSPNDSHSHDDRLEYVSTHLGDDEETSDLLNTTASLDTTCIPPEAHAMARFHLASERAHKPNVARTAWERPGTTLLVVLGLGVVTEYCDNNSSNSNSSNAADDAAADDNDSSSPPVMVQHTSDRANLVRYYQQLQKQGGSSYSPAYARAACLGPNLLAVSWGLPDGLVVFYRRLSCAQEVHWHAIFHVRPTRAVLENLQTHQQAYVSDDGPVPTADLLRVTDMVPLVVEQKERIPSASMAIARLGGYLEIVPLPHALWYGPELRTPSVKTKRQAYYAMGVSLANVTVLTTLEYHTDILALDVVRTTVQDDTAWDQKAYPDSPPSEHVVVASGTREGHETVSFWSVSTVYGREKSPSSDKKEIGFSIVARLAEAMDLGPAGPDVSIFATRGILRYWRRPRQVQLKADQQHEGKKTETPPQVTSVSVPAPTVSMRFLSEGDIFRVALLDWNGGVTVLDCDLLERAVAHSLTKDEYTLVYGQDSVTPLVKQLNDRMTTREQVDGTLLSLEWPSRILRGPEPLLAVTTDKPNALHLVSPFHDSEVSAVSVPLPKELVVRLHSFEIRGVLSLVSAEEDDDTAEISFAALNRMDATEIVRSLAKESKYEQAIAAAESLTSTLDQKEVTPVVEGCKRQLWEASHNIESLRAMTDDRFIVDQALQFSESAEVEALDDFRRVHDLALRRLSKASDRFGAAVVVGGLDGTDSLIKRIRGRMIKLGTYELLCRYFKTEPSWELFKEEILPIPAKELAQGFLRASDVASASLVCFRHSRECGWQEVLGETPLTVPVEKYQHLLPLAKGEGYFLDDSRVVLDSSHMPAYLSSCFGLDCTLGVEDERIITEHADVADVAKATSDERIRVLEQWYLSRAIDIQCFLSSIQSVLAFTDLALFALIPSEPISSSEGDQLRALNARYQLLSEFVQEQIDLDVSDIVQLERIDGLEMLDLVSTVMSGHEDSVEIYQRFKRFLLPLAHQKVLDTNERLDDELTRAVRSYCLRSVEESTDSATLRQAVSMCSAFLVLSRTDMHRHTRVIKDKEVAMSLLLSVVEVIVDCCSRIEVEPRHCRSIVDNLWSMYESMPIAAPGKMAFSETYETLSQQLDKLKHHLVILDVLFRWEGSRAFATVLKRMKSEDENLPSADEAVVAVLCGSFCDQVGWSGDESPSDDEGLLSDLLQDIDDINRLVFRDSLSIKDILAKSLLTPLLQQRQIRLLGSCIEFLKDEWLDRDRLSSEVANFVQNSVFASGDTSTPANIHAAIECQEILGKSLSAVSGVFHDVRRCLDSAEFVNSVLLSNTGADFVTPAAIRREPPPDVLDFLLARDPLLAIHDNSHWGEEKWACTANQSIRSYFQKKANPCPGGGRPDPPPPPPPGRAILHLAHLLGLSDSDALETRQKLVRACITAEIYGAASAICRTFFIDVSPFKEMPALLSSVADLVSKPAYKDATTKKELCTLVFRHYRGDLSTASSEAYARVLAFFTEIESAAISTISPLNNPLHAFERLCIDTQSEYSVNLADLFATLRNQTASDSVDDELLNALARYAIYWCISQCTRPKLGGPVPFDDLCISSNLALAAAFILHIQNEDLKKECCKQTKSIFETEQTASLNLRIPALATQFVKPNEDIVARLVHRGYTEFGARRSATMCQNAGYDAALQWAIMHCLDLGFDDPILQVRKQNQVDINKTAIRRVEDSLGELMAAVVDKSMAVQFPRTKASGVPSEWVSGKVKANLEVSSQHLPEDTSLKHCHKSNSDGASSIGHSNGTNTSVSQEHEPIESPIYRKLRHTPATQSSPLTKSSSTGDHSRVFVAVQAKPATTVSQNGKGNSGSTIGTSLAPMKPKTGPDSGLAPSTEVKAATPPVARSVVANGETNPPKIVRKPGTTVPPPHPRQAPRSLPPSLPKITTPRPPNSSPPMGLRKVPTTPTILSPDSRNRMKLQGQAALRSFKTPTPAKERSRLIAEGRRLLTKARSSPPKLAPNNGPVPPPSTANDDDGWNFEEDVSGG